MEYVLVGAVILINREACNILGYKLDEFYISYPTLAYSKNGVLDTGILFFEINEKMRYIPSHLIQETWDILGAKQKYPELFL